MPRVCQLVNGLFFFFFWCSTTVLDNGYQRLEIVTLITVIILIQIYDCVRIIKQNYILDHHVFSDLCQFVNLVRLGAVSLYYVM